MRDLLERYVRSLREQDIQRDAPEYAQDLGTFVYWLLERLGYRILEQTFRYDNSTRIKATGERQWGADILATKGDSDGVLRGYRFVLKRGHIGQTQWKHQDGYLPEDLWLASERGPDDFARRFPGGLVERWSAVAVHNGDFRVDQVGSQRAELMDKIQRRTAVDQVEWWDARRLVELAMGLPAADHGEAAAAVDPGIFPPGIRPFARLAIHSLSRDEDGSDFDADAVTTLIDVVLPLTSSIDSARWQRAVAELGLFAAMVDNECLRLSQVRGSTLPSLETTERILCRAVHHLVVSKDAPAGAATERARDLVVMVLRHYVGVARRLVEHLAPVLKIEHGLALPLSSERVDYSLRSLRMTGYLAVAGAAALDLDDPDTASMFGDRLQELFENNPGGALTPVLDDQIVELCLCWRFWQRLGRNDVAKQTAREFVRRYLARRNLNLPLPALWLEASVPPADRTLRILVDAHFGLAPHGFEDGGSLILPIALHLGWGASPNDDGERQEADALVAALAPSRPSRARDMAAGRQLDDVGPKIIHLQSWLPPDDAPALWYSQSLARRGLAHTFRLEGSFADLDREFRRFNREFKARSVASRLNLESIDWMAWKQLRNPPPMAMLIHPSPT